MFLGVSEHPHLALRRLPPDPVQFQVILGSLLGDGCLVGVPVRRRLRIVHRADRASYILWKSERLGALVDAPPRLREDGHLELRTIEHPLFDDLAALLGGSARCDAPRGVGRGALLELLAPLGLAVWMADLERLELRADAFLPGQRDLALVAGHGALSAVA